MSNLEDFSWTLLIAVGSFSLGASITIFIIYFTGAGPCS